MSVRVDEPKRPPLGHVTTGDWREVPCDSDAPVSRIAWGDAPRRHGRAMSPHYRRQGRIDGCARRPQSRFAGTSSTRQGGGFARPSEKSRSTTGRSRVLDRSRDCRGDRGESRGTGEAFPDVRWTNAATGTPSAPNKRPPAHVERHAGVAASDGTATASLGLDAAMRVRIVLVEGRRIAQQN